MPSAKVSAESRSLPKALRPSVRNVSQGILGSFVNSSFLQADICTKYVGLQLRKATRSSI
jgi:hypothetical protein